MKLMTEMPDDCVHPGACVHANGYCVDEDCVGPRQAVMLVHDAAAAHALMMAQDEFWKQDDLDSLDARDAVEMIGVRAADLMREWGFGSGEDA